jgi:hypothetical protein
MAFRVQPIVLMPGKLRKGLDLILPPRTMDPTATKASARSSRAVSAAKPWSVWPSRWSAASIRPTPPT